MTQIIKTQAIIKHKNNRPIITAASREPLLLLDARRYQYTDGEVINDILTIGSLDKDDLLLATLPNAKFGAKYSTENIPHFEFDKDSAIGSRSNFSTSGSPITAVVVYKLHSDDWGIGGFSTSRIYSLGARTDNRCVFLAHSEKLVVSAGVDLEGGAHFYDKKHDGWAVGVHQFNGGNSKIIDRLGHLKNISLSHNPGINSISIFGNASRPGLERGGVAYLAVYDGSVSESEMMDLFFEAKNNFGLL